MEKILFAILISILSISINTQKRLSQKEGDLLTGRLDNFRVGFKDGINIALWRFNLLMLSGNINKN